MSEYHKPVLLNEAIDGLVIDKSGTYVDVTYGGGGHTQKLLSVLNKDAKVFGIDRDVDAMQNGIEDSRLELIKGNFRYLSRYMRLYGGHKIDGVLADLGVSSYQFDKPERGFTYKGQAPLDMRMNKEQSFTASKLLQDYSEGELVRVFSQYGEIRNSKTIANAIVNARRVNNFETTNSLLQILDPLIRGSRLRYLSQVYQALRIEVNEEMNALQDFLKASAKVLRGSGRLVVITYHSIEDRMVKRFIKYGNTDGELMNDDFGNRLRSFKEVNRKVILPSSIEIANNKRSRSAKMRIAEKL